MGKKVNFLNIGFGLLASIIAYVTQIIDISKDEYEIHEPTWSWVLILSAVIYNAIIIINMIDFTLKDHEKLLVRVANRFVVPSGIILLILIIINPEIRIHNGRLNSVFFLLPLLLSIGGFYVKKCSKKKDE